MPAPFAMPCVAVTLKEVRAMSGDEGSIPPICTTWSRLSRGVVVALLAYRVPSGMAARSTSYTRA